MRLARYARAALRIAGLQAAVGASSPVRPTDTVAIGAAPLISSHNPPYLSSITIKGERIPFEDIGPPGDHVGGEAHTDLSALASPEAIASFLKKDTYRLPATVDREGYHGNRHYDWWLSGLRDFLLIQRTLTEHDAALHGGDAIFELGCASGRVLRHFVIQRPDLDCWGADIKLRHIEWMRMFLPQRLRIFHNTILPHLPLEDGSLSLVTAFSVFTHIDDLELAWLAEIRRILKPGGFFYVTIHSERTWREMKPGVPVYDALMQMRDHIPDYPVSEAFLGEPMPREKTVLYWDTAENYNCNVFHHTDYVSREWGRFFQIIQIIPRGSSYQDVVVLRKTE